MEKVFITKYALTKGILEKEAEIRDYGNGYIRAYMKEVLLKNLQRV